MMALVRYRQETHMAPESSGWLTSVFTHAARDAGATVPEQRLQEEANSLLAAWCAKGRTCHNTKFLIRVLDAIDNLAGCAHAPDELQVAAFYHGAVFFTPRSLDYVHVGRDLMAGANLAQQRLPELGMPADVVERITSLIESVVTAEGEPADVDQQVFHDALLASLTMPPQDYRDYREQMADQYEHLPRRLFLLGRRRQVQALLERPAIFVSPLADDNEELARSNLTSELVRLNQEIGENTDEDSDATSGVHTAGPSSGTIIIKKVKAKLKAAAQEVEEQPMEAAPRVEPVVDEPEEPVEEPLNDVSSLEAIEDALAEFDGSTTQEQPRLPDA